MKDIKQSTENININLTSIGNNFKAGISIDCVIFGFDENELKILLMQSDMEPYKGLWSLIGDLVHKNESLDDAANRILMERTGMKGLFMHQIHTFGGIKRHPLGRVISIAYFSLVKIKDYKLGDASKSTKAHWHSTLDIDHLAFDHNEIFQAALEALRQKVKHEPIGFNLLPKKFTLPMLQNLYECILGKNLDKRNFRKKILKYNFLVDLGQTQQNVAHRPARLYSFDEERYQELVQNGFVFDII